MRVIAHARAHAQRGNARAAIDLLKPLVDADGDDDHEARQLLAEIYRSLGAPDQAARWGIVFDGWTTPFERDRLARTLARYHNPAVFLRLPNAGADPIDLASVPELRASYVARDKAVSKRASDAWHARPERRREVLSSLLWMTAFVLVVLGALGPVVYLWGARLLAHDAGAVSAAATGWILFAIAGVAVAVGLLIERRRRHAAATALAGLAIAAVAAALFAVAALWSAG